MGKALSGLEFSVRATPASGKKKWIESSRYSKKVKLQRFSETNHDTIRVFKSIEQLMERSRGTRRDLWPYGLHEVSG